MISSWELRWIILVLCHMAVLSIWYLSCMITPPHKRRSLAVMPWKMPPGPSGSLVVGSLMSWLSAKANSQSFHTFLVECAQYGEMTTLHMGTKTWVFLNTSRVVDEIIAKRAALTHERPDLPIASELVSRNQRFFLQKTKRWRQGRRILHQLMTGSGSKNHGLIAEKWSLQLLRLYLDEPSKWYAHNYRYNLSIVYELVTNQPLHKANTNLDDLQRVTSTFLTAINSSIVDFFPQLAGIPVVFQFWRPCWESLGLFHLKVFRTWWSGMRPLLQSDSGASFLRDHLTEDMTDSDERAMYLTLLILSAGADNSRMTMNAWIMSCISAPETVERARQEIEHVCGENAERLPCLEDLSLLPYTSAIVKEVLRWRPTVPLIPQRVLVEDMQFEGYHFPAGTEFLVNSIAVCQADYQNPSKFLPERWLKESNPSSSVAQDLWAFAFSAGRRMCVGYKLAQKELFVAFARLIYCFEIYSDEHLDDRILNAFSPGEPFPIKVKVRSKAFERLIRTESEKTSNDDSST